MSKDQGLYFLSYDALETAWYSLFDKDTQVQMVLNS